MPSGLAALLDDVAAITKMAAASIDDIGAAATRAGTKAAGVVVDDAAVTPRYVTGFTPQRELPIIWAIARGSLRNKLFILLPVALLLSVFLPAAIPVLLILGGAYLCFEGAEKVMEALGGEAHGETVDGPIEDVAAFEKERISGAIRTDFILSAEIMAIALATVADNPVVERGIILAVVAVAITAGVYGLVGLIVKMDDAGLHLAQRGNAGARALGRGLLVAMPRLMTALSVIGTAAMIWVGGHIIIDSVKALGWPTPYDLTHHAAEAVGHAMPFAQGLVEWTIGALISGIFGLMLGSLIAAAVHRVQKMRSGPVPAH